MSVLLFSVIEKERALCVCFWFEFLWRILKLNSKFVECFIRKSRKWKSLELTLEKNNFKIKRGQIAKSSNKLKQYTLSVKISSANYFVGKKYSSAKIFVTSQKFRHFLPTKILTRAFRVMENEVFPFLQDTQT